MSSLAHGLTDDILDPVTPTLCRQLYIKFKEANSETWQEILEIHDMIEVSDSSPQTVAQHAQTFNKICKKVVGMVSFVSFLENIA